MSFKELGQATVGIDGNGNLVVVESSIRRSTPASGFGADFGADDFGADDDFAASLSPSEASYFGALSREERQNYKKRKRGMREQNRDERRDFREDRRDDRRDNNDRPGQGQGKPSMRASTPYTFSGSYTVTAAGAWQIQILPQTSATLTESWATGPAGTYLTALTIGVLPVVVAGNIDITVLGPTSFIRGLVEGREVSPSLPIVFAGTTTATSGVISCGVAGRGPSPV